MPAYPVARLPKYHRLAEEAASSHRKRRTCARRPDPSEPDLCATYALSRGTVRQALQL
ncbi:MAG: hypothetical protein R2838_03375 [Caldilineaceae bacterium]